jgi:hypothetical protein
MIFALINHCREQNSNIEVDMMRKIDCDAWSRKLLSSIEGASP